MAAGQLGLGLAYLGNPEVVVAELAGNVGLVVTGEERLGLGDVGPLGESLAPPLVVLGDGVELRKIEGQGARPVLPRVA